MDGWTITKVFRVNGKLTVADTIEKAIELYRKFASPNNVEVKSVEQVSGSIDSTDGAITVDVQDLERHYAEQLAKLTEEIERLKHGGQSTFEGNLPRWKYFGAGVAGNDGDQHNFLIRSSRGHYFTSSCIGGDCYYIELESLEQLPGLPKED